MVTEDGQQPVAFGQVDFDVIRGVRCKFCATLPPDLSIERVSNRLTGSPCLLETKGDNFRAGYLKNADVIHVTNPSEVRTSMMTVGLMPLSLTLVAVNRERHQRKKSSRILTEKPCLLRKVTRCAIDGLFARPVDGLG